MTALTLLVLSKQGIWVRENSAAQSPIRMGSSAKRRFENQFFIRNTVLDKRRPKGKSARGSTKHPGQDFPFSCNCNILQSNHLNTST
ncbi:hypothetical protein AVEN_27535-1 [Araneus ventricosus]|uniref:Uncharacterized protein n=1 Tax=Araneus ventricosus TaxID=182803 RepID=A0A4Y2NRF1_ARAVE|nr:hypothetical protein AVEN_27535-1 [Araneus ventricosus]